MFKSINELEKFDYEDCQICAIELVDKSDNKKNLQLTLQALIVRGNNSQNANYTDSYADETKMIFYNASFEALIEKGIRRYDADDNLISETPDVEIPSEKIESILLSLIGESDDQLPFLCDIECEEKSKDHFVYSLVIETGKLLVSGLTDLEAPIYELKIGFDSVEVNWERYLNKVQK